MELFAQTMESAIWKELVSYGALGIFTLAVGLGLWRLASYVTDRLFNKDDGIVPFVVKKHFDSIDRLAETSEKAVALQEEHAANASSMAAAMSALAASVQTKLDPVGDSKYRDHIFSTFNTNEALLHLACAAKECTDNPTAKALITQAIKAVDRG